MSARYADVFIIFVPSISTLAREARDTREIFRSVERDLLGSEIDFEGLGAIV